MAAPCRAIRDDPTDAYEYTATGNLAAVAVVDAQQNDDDRTDS